MSVEDKMVNAIIEHHQEDGLRGYDYQFEPEVHYNFYGDRGVADLLVRGSEEINSREFVSETVFEIKADAAIESATGANEIIRQFNRMRRYFYRDESRKVPSEMSFELCFVISESTVNHVAENFKMYRSALSKKLNSNAGEYDSERILFRFPDSDDYAPAGVGHAPTGDDVRTAIEWKEWLDGLVGTAPESVYEILDDLGY